MSPTKLLEFLKNRVALFKHFPDDRLTELVRGSRLVAYEANESARRPAALRRISSICSRRSSAAAQPRPKKPSTSAAAKRCGAPQGSRSSSTEGAAAAECSVWPKDRKSVV